LPTLNCYIGSIHWLKHTVCSIPKIIKNKLIIHALTKDDHFLNYIFLSDIWCFHKKVIYCWKPLVMAIVHYKISKTINMWHVYNLQKAVQLEFLRLSVFRLHIFHYNFFTQFYKNTAYVLYLVGILKKLNCNRSVKFLVRYF
jgi:hypothetical protein